MELNQSLNSEADFGEQASKEISLGFEYFLEWRIFKV